MISFYTLTTAVALCLHFFVYSPHLVQGQQDFPSSRQNQGRSQRQLESPAAVSYYGTTSTPSSSSAAGCPLRCLCFKTTVRCMFLHLEKIPEVPSDTTILDLRFNRIHEVPPNIFSNLKQLNTLLLNNNHITRLDNGAFHGLRNLQHLYLYKNRIRHIDAQVFQGMDKLEQLYLHYNAIQELEPEMFSNMTRLERLFLHNNRIQRIPYGSFQNLHNMKRLRLDSNALVCDCEMMALAQMLDAHPETQAAATCQQPLEMQGKPVSALKDMHLDCRKPVIMEEPRDVEVNFGSTVYFSCKAEGDPTPSIVWLHNSNEIAPRSEPRYSILEDGTLMIANAQDKDVGGYECMAKSAVGEAKSRKAKMHQKKSVTNARVRPRFVRVPTDEEVPASSNVALQCEAAGGQIAWSLNDQPLLITTRHELSEEGTLTIRHVVSTDEGVYRCTASNNYGTISSIAELRIVVPPIWHATPLDQTTSLGSTMELKCEAIGKPEPVVTWTHNGRPVPDDDERISILNQGKLLRVSPVQRDDDGEYVCSASNKVGSVDAATNVIVRRGTLPKFTQDFTLLSRYIESGRELQLACSASGVPQPQIFWKKNDLTVIESPRVTFLPSGTMIISQFNPSLDSGLYECIAYNDHGLITSPQIRIDRNYVQVLFRAEAGLDDSTIYDAVSQAKADVELAERDTLEQLFGNMSRAEIKSPGDLLRLARFPKQEARDIARAAEIYERALQIIGQHAERMNFSLTAGFTFNDLLSRRQLETLSRFSGCISHRKPKTNCSSEMCFHSRYRTIDGSCNNLQEPMWGTSYTTFKRLLEPVYENGFNLPIGWDPTKKYNGFTKPLARQVSSRIITTDAVSPDSMYTHMLMQWGQFLDHDLDHALPSLSIESFGERISCRGTCENVAPCFPMKVPEGDLRVRSRRCIEFTRSAAVCGSGITSVMFDSVQQREQINQLTSFIDASQVYGSSEDEITSLRSSSNRIMLRQGLIVSEGKYMMPFATDDTPVDCRRNIRDSDVTCFLGGDIRANEQMGLLAMHTIWFRQHNFLAPKLKELNPTWDDEVVFQETRKIVGAQMQHITYAHWLPYVVGKKGMDLLGAYEGYKPEVNPTISTEFATAALRFGHTLINPILRRLDANFRTIREGDLPLRNAFFSPWRLLEEGGVDPLMRGLFSTPAKMKTPDQLLNSHLTDELFTTAHLVALDLAAMNIQRGRDHGIPSYNEYREFCGLRRATSFHDLKTEISDPGLRRKLEETYGHVDNIDLWVGGVAEDIEWDDARVGPTFRCIIVDQFKRLRDGDRFWYENPSVFRPEQLTQIKVTSLARVLCDNGDALTHVKKDVFHMESGLVHCDSVPSPQLAFWSTGCCGQQPAPAATCSVIDTAFVRNAESNVIRVRRSVNPAMSENSIAINSGQKNDDQWKFIHETLTRVSTTVEKLQSRIQELETRCDKTDEDEELEAESPIKSLNATLIKSF